MRHAYGIFRLRVQVHSYLESVARTHLFHKRGRRGNKEKEKGKDHKKG
jgi:hypothetical protein